MLQIIDLKTILLKLKFNSYTHMEIQFIQEENSLSKLISQYLNLNICCKLIPNNKKKIVVNTILVNLCAKVNPLQCILSQISNSMEIYSSEGNMIAMLATLMKELFTHYPSILQQAQQRHILQLIQICDTKIFITICTNEYIQLLGYIVFLLDSKAKINDKIVTNLLNILQNSKFQINAYKQTSRLEVYRVLLVVLNNMAYSSDLDYPCESMVQLLIQCTENQKDPRNICMVFEAYLLILTKYTPLQLQKHSQVLFDNLEAYYPIDFIGDEDDPSQAAVDVNKISLLLDKCLCAQVFQKLTYSLLTVKIRQPPIKKFVPTFINFIICYPSYHIQSTNILLTLCEDQYLGQPQNQENLSLLCAHLINHMFPKTFYYSYKNEIKILQFLNILLVKKIMNNEKNNEQMGSVITLMKGIINNTKGAINCLIIRYIIAKFLQHERSPGHLICKLGVLLLIEGKALQSPPGELQLLYLIKLAQIVENQTEVTLKVIVLKIFIQVVNETKKQYLKIINDINDGRLKRHCIEIISDSNIEESRSKLVKAYMDFVLCVYGNCSQAIKAILTCQNKEAKTYGTLMIVAESQFISQQYLKKAYLNLGELMLNEPQYILDTLRIMKLSYIQSVISRMIIPKKILMGKQLQLAHLCMQISSILYDKVHNQIQDQHQEENILKAISHQFPKQIWRLYSYKYLLKQHILCKSKVFNESKIILNYENTEQDYFIKKLQTFINVCFKIINKQKKIDILNFSDENERQLLLVPCTKLKQGFFKKQYLHFYEPTLRHFYWLHLKKQSLSLIEKQKIIQIISCLPQQLLKTDSTIILPLLLQNPQNLPIIAKITSHLLTQSEQIGKFCLLFLSQTTNLQQNLKYQIKNIIACLHIFEIIIKSNTNHTHQSSLIFLTHHKIELQKILDKLLFHPKRMIRQATRHILTQIDTLK